MVQGVAHGSADDPKKIFGRTNIGWGGPKRAGASAKGDIASVTSDFANVDEDNVSIFDEGFRDVLIDRYGVDPREVDTRRGELAGEHLDAQQELDRVTRLVHNYKSLEHDIPESVEQRLTDAKRGYITTQQSLEEFNKENPAEWSQYWLVTDGHFHNTLGCSTLRPTTNVGMYAPASGMDPDEAIELAGSRVCTHCVPDAPVDIESRPSFVQTEEERDVVEQRQRREEEKREKEKEAEQRRQEREKSALAKKLDPKKNLDEEITVKSLRMSGYEDASTTTTDIKKIRDHLKDEMFASVLNLTGLQDQPVHENYLNILSSVIRDKEHLTLEQRKQHDDVLRDTFGTEKFWAVESCQGDVDAMVDNLASIRGGVEALGAKKGKDFDKMMDDVYGKRTFNTLVKESNHPIQRQHVRDDYDDIVKQRFEIVKGWIRDPESFRDYLK